MEQKKMIIYQVLPRLFGNGNFTNKRNGTLQENGVGKFSNFTGKALREIKNIGITHIWFTGILEHATKTDYSPYGICSSHPAVVKGQAGSPYAVKDYYDVDPDLSNNVPNRMAEFRDLVQRSKEHGLGVIIDFVPNHVARQYYSDSKPDKVKDFGEEDNQSESFSPDNNFYYIPGKKLELPASLLFGESDYNEFPAKATGNDCFVNNPSQTDWYETIKLNYGVDYSNHHSTSFMPIPDTWIKMKNILLFWANIGIDGFRCDMAEMVPVQFWSWVIPKVKLINPDIFFIAEVYNPLKYKDFIYRGTFDYLYDKVGLYDTLRSVVCGQKPASDITFAWQSLDELQPKMLNFLENHDEQRIASDFFAKDPEKAIPAMIVAATMHTNPIMIYFGQELGERGMDDEGFSGLDGRTSIFDYWSLSSIGRWWNGGKFGTQNLLPKEKDIRKFYVKLLNICLQEECIRQGTFFDLMYANYENQSFDSTKQFAYIRSYKDSFLLVVANFSDQDAEITVKIPNAAFDYIHINPLDISSAKDLFTGRAIPFDDVREKVVSIKVDAYSGKIIKFSMD